MASREALKISELESKIEVMQLELNEQRCVINSHQSCLHN